MEENNNIQKTEETETLKHDSESQEVGSTEKNVKLSSISSEFSTKKETDKKKKLSKRTILEIVGAIVLIMSLLAYSGATDSTNEVSQKYSDLQNEYDSLVEEFDSLQAEYDSYKSKMQPYETLEKAEAEARQIEANKAIEENAKAEAEKKAAEEKAAAEEEAKRKALESASIEQKNALNKGKDYLAFTAFSYTGLISQLEYEGFSTESATYAADNCGADWNEQAAKKAHDYLDFSSFSRDGLIDQLLYEGFTQEQAEYGVSSVGY